MTIFGIETEIFALILSAIAIVISLSKEIILPFILKPRIFLEPLQPSEKEVVTPKKRYKERTIKIKIVNKPWIGSTIAKGVFVKIEKIKIKKTVGKIRTIDPFPLPWAIYDEAKKDLAKNEYDIVLLASEVSYKPGLRIIHRKEKSGRGFPTGEYYISITIYGDNFSPVKKEFKIELSKHFGELKFVR